VIELLPESYVARLDLPKIFGRAAPFHVDLGCGDGAFLFALAERNPEKNFFGIERLAARVEKACRKAAKIDNMRVLHAETSYAVRYLLPERAVETFYLLFPDPWPKRRHWRRRIVTADFLKAIHGALEGNGIFRIATDQADYFNHIRKFAEESDYFTVAPTNIDNGADGSRATWTGNPERVDEACGESINHFPASTFEQRFRRRGVDIYRLALRKLSPLM